jgi:hypothetical protein
MEEGYQMTKISLNIYKKIIEYRKLTKQNPTINYLAQFFKLNEKDINGYLQELCNNGKMKINNGKFSLIKPEKEKTVLDTKDNAKVTVSENMHKDQVYNYQVPKIEKIVHENFKPSEIVGMQKKILDDNGGVAPDIIIKPSKKELNKRFGKHSGHDIHRHESESDESFRNRIKDEYINKPTQNKLVSILFKILIMIPVVVGIFISIYFTKLWFNNFFNNVISLCLSLFIVVGVLMSYQIYKKLETFKRWIFFIVWLFIISFSIITGINGQLNLQNKINEQKTTQNETSKTNLYNHYESQIKDLKIDIDNVRLERDNLMKTLSRLDYVENRKEYSNVNWLIHTKEKKLKELKNKLEITENEKERLLKNNVEINKVEKVDFFHWLNSITKIDSEILRLIMYLLLSIFADLLPTLFFGVVLFDKEWI